MTQRIAEHIGRSACLALSYLKIIHILLKTKISDGELLAQLAANYEGLVKKGIMDEDCYINNAEQYLKYIFPLIKVSVEKTNENPHTLCIAFNNKHFVIIDKDGNIVWNSLGKANNESWRQLPTKSYRIVRIK